MIVVIIMMLITIIIIIMIMITIVIILVNIPHSITCNGFSHICYSGGRHAMRTLRPPTTATSPAVSPPDE